MNFWKPDDKPSEKPRENKWKPKPEVAFYLILNQAIADLQPGETVEVPCEGDWQEAFNLLYSNKGVYRDAHPDCAVDIKDDHVIIKKAAAAPLPPIPAPAPEPAPEPAPIDEPDEPDVASDDDRPNAGWVS